MQIRGMYFQIKLRIDGIEIAEKNTFLINRFKKKKKVVS